MNDFYKHLTLLNDLSELRKIHGAVDQLADRCDLSDEVKHDINLALEEVVANIIHYGYDDEDQHYIGVEIDGNDRQIVLTIEDEGIPFNPLEEEPPRMDAPLKERSVGGHGIHLARNVVDHMGYRREGNKNIVTLKKNLGS